MQTRWWSGDGARDEYGAAAREVAQAVSVAAAYFEDSLESSPDRAGGGDAGRGDVRDDGRERARGFAGARDGGRGDAGGGSGDGSVPRGWLAGVRGALKN